ncbi:alpha/beta-Hydrolase [Glarea lozoyensis ATCC 20868]|uniref:Cutinase n=1 Tax=Glarea lozoyensis (strain ATCC 20868 / MF5171) TaxID=1116229 RepID=S3CYR3_GLAL2|nr:alpha/beta-Hydrolase [Glarea lozoyensis ATCC 20868]EPE30730.1 alpha/beta-Hydrolase [Glarea lozoyensis ATCC 20868]
MKLTLLILLPLATAFPLSLFKRADLTLTTQNDLLNGTPCKPLTVIFARGTTSPGNVGESTGPPFFQEIAKLVGAANLAVQGVTYPASIFGFLGGGDTAGSKTLAGLVNQAFTQCPSTKVVVSGYSQGGQLVHNAARQLSAAVSAKVSSVVIFGDPNYGSAVGTIPASKVKVFCHTGDNICEGGITVTSAHLNYKNDAPAAAKFVASLAGY